MESENLSTKAIERLMLRFTQCLLAGLIVWKTFNLLEILLTR